MYKGHEVFEVYERYAACQVKSPTINSDQCHSYCSNCLFVNEWYWEQVTLGLSV